MNKHRTAAQDVRAILRPFPHALARQDLLHRERRGHFLLATSALYELPHNPAALLGTNPARALAAFPVVTALLGRADAQRPVTGGDRAEKPIHREPAPLASPPVAANPTGGAANPASPRTASTAKPPPENPLHPEKAPPRAGPLRNGNPRGNPNAAPRCGAKTRLGCPCKSPAMRNGRCRMHGGASTGPRTPEGRARIAAARTIHGRCSAATRDFFRGIADIARRGKALMALLGDGRAPVAVEALARLLPPQKPMHRGKPAETFSARINESSTFCWDDHSLVGEGFHKCYQPLRSRCWNTKTTTAKAPSQTGSTNSTHPPPCGSP